MPGIDPFTTARLPRIVFGAGVRSRIAEEVRGLGGRALIVTGGRSVRVTPVWDELCGDLAGAGIAVHDVPVTDEPSPKLVDETVSAFKDKGIEVVVGLGGGSALDAAKAIAGLLPRGNSVMDHLEGVGAGVPYEGPSLPFIAVPTTAGTGSEATKNSVLSQRGAGGFKKSFRDDRLVARVAIVDPEFLASCPPELIGANGMDAFTQLFESYLSTRSNPMTDALAWSGLEAFRDGFFAALQGSGAEAEAGRSRLSYAALLSGITLAQTGLGAVHGLASPLGAFFPIPHGVVCGTLVAAATAANIRALRDRDPAGRALRKYAKAGSLLTGRSIEACEDAVDRLTETLEDWVSRLALPRLTAYGMSHSDIERVVAESGGSSMKTNPIVLEPDDIAWILRQRL